MDFTRRVDELLSEALTRNGEAQDRYVRDVALEDPRSARELRALLGLAREADGFLSIPAARSRDRLLADALDFRGAVQTTPTDRCGEVLGAYRIERRIARALRSEIYLASRVDDEWDQQVAIKVLTRGVDSDDVLRRFLAERQILSVLHHPNIATLLDGGITPDGYPYFVMEFIEGEPITDYCARKGLSLKARVGICRQVCGAVAFSHRHMVVHRDLKPSNILVTGEGQVKLLDFGIAKLLGPELDPAISPQTVEVVRPMTPRYASPEQLHSGVITTSTDVYQLGLLFTELLAGVAYAKDALDITGSHGPSLKPSRIRQTSGSGLPYSRRELAGDLDWVLLKALETRPEDRYESAAALDHDLENFQKSRAVTARKATAPYLLRKFLRRRPVQAASLAVTLLASLAFIGALSHFNRQLEVERQSAVEAAARAQEVKKLLVGFIQSPDPFSGDGADARVSEVLLNSEAVVENQLAERPELQVELYGALGDVYQNLAMNERSAAMRLEELRLRRAAGETRSFEVLQGRRKLAQSRMALGETEAAFSELAALRDRLADAFPSRLRERAIVEMEMGSFHRVYGRTEDALPFLENAIEMAQRIEGDPVFLAEALHVSSLAHDFLHRYDVAETQLTRAYRLLTDELGPSHVKSLVLRTRIAANLSNQGRYRDSIEIYDEVLPPLQKQLGPLHEEVLSVMNNFAFSVGLSGDLERSVELHYRVLERRRQNVGDVHRDVADSLQNIGALTTQLERYDEAIAALREAAAIYAKVNRPGQAVTAYPHVSLAIAYSKMGAVDQQETQALKALELLEGQVDPAHPALLRSLCLLGDARVRRGIPEEGIPLLERGVAGLAQHSDRFGMHLEACRNALSRARSSDAYTAF